eukprot:3349414-Amphidinium_carterae.1
MPFASALRFFMMVRVSSFSSVMETCLQTDRHPCECVHSGGVGSCLAAGFQGLAVAVLSDSGVGSKTCSTLAVLSASDWASESSEST